MANKKRNSKRSSSTTIQVKKDLKNELDLLKLMGNHEDLNALISELKDFYVENNQVKNHKLEKLLKRLKNSARI